MGCFLACFGSSKDGKRQRQRIQVLPRDQRNGNYKPVQSIISQKQERAEKPISLFSDIREKPQEEELSFAARKKVTFDSNVRTYEPVSVHGSIESLPESGEKGKEENPVKSSQSNSPSQDDSNTSSLRSYPPNHRYQNCRESDDEYEGIQYGDSDLDEDEDNEDDEFSDSDEEDHILGSRTKISPAQVITEEIDPAAISSSPQRELKTIRANPNARDRSAYVHPVLNPVENLSQWKAAKAKGKPPLKLQKENLTLTLDQEPPRLSFSLEPSFKQQSLINKSKINQSENLNQELAVNASLSNWLVSPETTTTPINKSSTIDVDTVSSQKSTTMTGTAGFTNSPRSQEDRPILGALTLEELRQFSASNSPRRSPSRSPDEMPIIGTVGTYWNHDKESESASSYKGIPNTTSKYREDKKVNWHSTPFEARLERALNKGVAEV